MNFLQIGKDTFPVQTLREAQATWLTALANYGWPASDAPRCIATLNGERYRISYNGRAWRKDGSEVTSTVLT